MLESEVDGTIAMHVFDAANAPSPSIAAGNCDGASARQFCPSSVNSTSNFSTPDSSGIGSPTTTPCFGSQNTIESKKPVSGRPRDFVSAGAVRRRLRPDRQLPARVVALLRQFAGFLRAAGRAGLHPLLSRVLLHRARRAHLHPAPRRAARPAAFHRIVPAPALP